MLPVSFLLFWSLPFAGVSDLLSGRTRVAAAVRHSSFLPSYAGHWGLLAIVGLLVAHVQMTTRLLLAACPAVYWYAADQVLSPAVRETTKRRMWAWWAVWGSLGIALHPNFYPWT